MRNYKRKTERGLYPREIMLEGVRLVIDCNQKIKPTARELGLNYKTLGRYVALKRKNANIEEKRFGYSNHRRIFTDDQEAMLADYLIHASRIFFGLDLVEFRTLTYEFALKNNIHTPTNWTKKQMTGKDWMYQFFQRHPQFSLRSPEPTSLARMTSFNKHNVGLFYDNLQSVIEKYAFTADRIYNCDETGVTTVQKPTRKIAEKGVKRVGTVVSQEKGKLITVCGTINAIGGCIPPFVVFPRVQTQPLWEDVLPVGSKAEGHPKASGWMTAVNFVSYLKHFTRYVRPSKEFPILLLLDNHASHVSLEAIDFCRENHIVLVSFPPHCSHELQPLDKTIYGPFKAFFNEAADSWMRKPVNAGKVMTIHNLPAMITEAFQRAFTLTNIISGFESTGIQPLNRNRIPDERYLTSYVTDQPARVSSEPQQNDTPNEQPSSSSQGQQPSSSGQGLTSPEVIRPFPKAAPRSEKIKRKKVMSQVLTSTPVKRALAEAAESKKKPRKNQEKRKQSVKRNIFIPDPIVNSDSDSESDNDSPVLDSESEISDLEIQSTDEIKQPNAHQLDEGDYVLTKFQTKKTTKYYIGKIESIDIDGNTADCMFLKRKPTKEGQFLFAFPEKLDASEVNIEDILYKLMPPTSGGTMRTGDIFTFHSSFVNNFPYPIM